MPGYMGNPQTARTPAPEPSIHKRLLRQGVCGEAFTEKPVTWSALKWTPVCMLSDDHPPEVDHYAADPCGPLESVVRWPVAVDASLQRSA